MTKKPSKARKVLEKPQDEIELRRWRGRTEISKIEALEPKLGPYGTFRASSSAGGRYEVEIRDLAGRTNSCGCIDHRVNGLGTCKHIEGVLCALKKKLGARAFAAAAASGSPRVEVFLRRDGDPVPSLGGPATDAEAHAFLAPFLGENGALASDLETVARLLEAAPGAPADTRVSRHFGPWTERERRLAAREKARETFLAAVGSGRASFKLPLLPYQREGAAHLAFHERALPGRRDGTRQDRASHRRLRDSGVGEGRRARACRLAHFRQSRMGKSRSPASRIGPPALSRGPIRSG